MKPSRAYRKVVQVFGNPYEPTENETSASLETGILDGMFQTERMAHFFPEDIFLNLKSINRLKGFPPGGSIHQCLLGTVIG